MQTRLLLSSLLSVLLSAAIVNIQAGHAVAKGADDQAGKKAEKTTAPSAQDIANAKSQGLVWVNLSTRTYSKEGAAYGKSKHGKFISEDEAKSEGFHEAKPAASRKPSKKQRDQSGIDATIDTHSSVPPKP
jgi:N-acetylmuramoyl-L-alanine amidase CwlA